MSSPRLSTVSEIKYVPTSRSHRSSCWSAFYSPSGIVEAIKNEVSEPQDCKAADMLRFLFSFCGTRACAARVNPMDGDLITAFEMVQRLANEKKTLLKVNLNLV